MWTERFALQAGSRPRLSIIYCMRSDKEILYSLIAQARDGSLRRYVTHAALMARQWSRPIVSQPKQPELGAGF